MGNPRPLTPEDEAVMRRLFDQGVSLLKIGKAVGRSEKTVRQWVIANNLRPIGDAPVEWPADRLALLKELYAAGHSYSHLAEALGTTRGAIGGKVSRLGLTRTLPSAPQRVKDGLATRNRREGERPPRPAKPRKPKRLKAAPRPILTYAAHPRGVPLPKVEFPPVIIDATHAKPWLERAFGECAYPIAGEGADTFSCCAPCGDRNYCPSHRAVMFTPPKDPPSAFARLARRAA